MTDMQILTLAISCTVPIALLFLGNSQLTDVKEGLGAKIGLFETKLEAGIDRLEAKLDTVQKILADHAPMLQH